MICDRSRFSSGFNGVEKAPRAFVKLAAPAERSKVPEPAAAPGTIVQVVRPGYGTDERPLRPAAVVVAKGP